MSESTELQRAVENLTTSIQQLRTELVRKDVYQSNERARDIEIRGVVDSLRDLKDAVDKRALASDLDELEKAVESAEGRRKQARESEEKRRRDDRRLLLASLVFPVLLMLMQVYVASQLGSLK